MERHFAKLFETAVWGQILVTTDLLDKQPVLVVRWVHDGTKCVGIVPFEENTHGVLIRNRTFDNFTQQQAVEYILDEIRKHNNGVENGTTHSS